MNQDEQDNLWELLGKARERKASPFFANKVMHAVRRETTATEAAPQAVTLWAWLRKRWIVPVAAGACAVLASVLLLRDPASPTAEPSIVSTLKPEQDPLAEMVTVLSESDEYDTALSVLLANEDNSVWIAADPSSIY